MKSISPVKIFIMFWVFCLVLYAFGPFSWVTYKPFLFWTLNITYLLCFCIGWYFGGYINTGRRVEWTERDDKRLIKKLGIFIYINLFYEVINLFRTFLFSSFDIVGLIRRLLYGIFNMGDSYNSFQDNVEITSAGIVGGSIITLFNYIWDIWAFSTLILSVYYFRKFSIHQKIIAALAILLEIIAYLARGTNIGVFRIILIFLVFFYLKYLKDSSSKNISKKYKQKNKMKLVLLAMVGATLAILLFDHIMKSRGGIAYWQMDFYNVGGIHINKDSIFFRILPSEFHQLLVSLSGYLSQGFYGMSLSLRVPWEPNWGIGGGMALQNLIENFIPDISQNTYQVRIEQFGWNSYSQWHSLYTWIANDLTFWGVTLFMLLFGYIFKKSLADAIELNNPYAKVMIYFMFLASIFLPCNNQISQTTYVLFAFCYVFINWQMSKRGVRLVFSNKT